jgi:hypothetical protein
MRRIDGGRPVKEIALLRLIMLFACLSLSACAYETGPPDTSTLPKNAPESMVTQPAQPIPSALG